MSDNNSETYIAINHNGVAICSPTTKARASAEACDYTWATGNRASVIEAA